MQNSAEILKNVPSRIAVSPVMPPASVRIAVIRLGGTPIAFAGAFAVWTQGFQKLLVENFSRRIRSHSILFHFFYFFLMIVDDFNVMRTVIFPSKTDPPWVVAPDADWSRIAVSG
jgi:hypothetical protein